MLHMMSNYPIHWMAWTGDPYLTAEEFKTRFYRFEGYNPENGYPTRATLEKMNLKRVADALEKKGRLG